MRWIGAWQGIGGVYSAAVFLDHVSRISDPTGFSHAVLITGVAAALLLAVCGHALYHRRTQAILPSLFLHALQLLAIMTASSFYKLTLGPHATLFLEEGEHLSLQAGVTPTLFIHWDSLSNTVPGVGINLFARFCFLRLLFVEVASDPSPDVTGSTPSSTDPASAPANVAAEQD